MTTRPLVSVLMPVFNADRHLRDALDSLSRQSLDDLEIVAVDDGSTDDSGEILASWSAHEPRLRILRLQHRGLVEALNAGLEACRSDLVARMDADDLAHPDRLRLQYEALSAHPEIDVLGCRVTHFADDGVGKGLEIYESWLNSLLDNESIRREIFIESPLPHPSVVVRKRVLEDVGGYRDNGWPEDYDLWLRLAAFGCTFSKLPQTLLRWRDHERRLTRTDSRYAVERFIECKAHYLCRGPLRDRDRVVVWGAGQTGRRLSKHLLREGARLHSFIDIDPRKCGRTLRGAPVVTPGEILSLDTRPLILAAVASRGARAKIRHRLRAEGWSETRDFWCVA